MKVYCVSILVNIESNVNSWSNSIDWQWPIDTIESCTAHWCLRQRPCLLFEERHQGQSFDLPHTWGCHIIWLWSNASVETTWQWSFLGWQIDSIDSLEIILWFENYTLCASYVNWAHPTKLHQWSAYRTTLNNKLNMKHPLPWQCFTCFCNMITLHWD